MSLDLPTIDDRDYDALFAEVLARIPVHNPEWTNFNDADPGITLLQLFSFMTENLLYRSQQIPERNRIKFLNLLGIERQPADPAVGMVAFDNLRGQLGVQVLEPDEEVLAGKIPFRTRHGLAVLPIEARAFVKDVVEPGDDQDDIEALAKEAYASYLDDATEPAFQPVYYETKAVEWPTEGGDPIDLAGTADRALWLALLARSAKEVDVARTRKEIGGRVLTLGIVPDRSGSTSVLPAGGTDTSRPAGNLEYRVPNISQELGDKGGPAVATYQPVPATSDTDVLEKPGIVQLHLPEKAMLGMWEVDPGEAGVGNLPPLLEGDDANRLVTWIRIRPARSDTLPVPAPAGDADANAGGGSATGGGSADRNGTTSDGAAEDDTADQASVRLSWLGINAAIAEQRTHTVKELLGKGTGRPDQQYDFANTPVLLASVRLTVGGEEWERVDDLMTAGPEVPSSGRTSTGAGPDRTLAQARKYTIDRENGAIRFGDGIHGARPGAGLLVEASYDYGGGRAGLVATDAITKGPALPAGVKVTNPLATWGADEAESVAEAERRIPQVLRNRDRLVTASDFEEIAMRTPGVDMGRVEVQALMVQEAPRVRLPGVVTVMVIPKYDTIRPDTPEPDQFFLDAVCRHLDERRLLTTELHLRGPDYVDVWLSIGIEVVSGRDIAPVREAVATAIRKHYSALRGGVTGDGWPLWSPVERYDAWAVAARVDGVAKVLGVDLAPDPHHIEMVGLELPRLAGLAVRQGEPLPIADVRGTAEPTGDGTAGAGDRAEQPALPIPITPREC